MVQRFGYLYGETEVAFSVRGSIHLADGMEFAGPLDSLSFFTSKQFTQVIRRVVLSRGLVAWKIFRLVKEPMFEVSLCTKPKVLGITVSYSIHCLLSCILQVVSGGSLIGKVSGQCYVGK